VFSKNVERKILFLPVCSQHLGVKKLLKDHPDVIIFSAAIDRQLNSKGYILPGLGDAGDRVGTL
jgi:uracil phosphoribosyltransferase